MAQQIKQDIDVDVKVQGASDAVRALEAIDSKIKSITKSARSLSASLGSIGKAKLGSNLESGVDASTRKMKAATAQAKKLNTVWKDIEGNKIALPVAAVKTPAPVSMRDMSKQVSGYGMSTTRGSGAPSASSIDKSTAATRKLAAASKDATPSLQKFGTALQSSSKSAKDASWNFFRTRAAIAAVAAVSGAAALAVSKWFNLASDYAEANHLFYTTLASSINDVADAEKTAAIQGKDLFGNLTGESIKVTPAVAAAAAEVDRMAQAMMLDPTQLKRTYATFYEMANSAGMATDKVMKLSQGMTQLSYDLSSLWDKPFDETASKLQSGISGISTAVKSYGIDISRTAADQWLMNHAIEASYNDLTRANKMIVMYNMLMEHTSTAQGDLARSALQPANMLRILGEQSRIAGRMMGAAVFPVVTKLIPLFIMLAQAVQRAAASIASFLGMKLGSWYKEASAQWNNYMSNLDQSFSGGIDLGADEAEDELGGVGDAADKAGKKLKEMTNFTLPFDELHMLQESMDGDIGSGGGKGGGGGGGGIGDIDIPMLDPYQWDSDLNSIILADAQKTLDTIKQLIDKTFGTGTVDAFKAAIDSMGRSAIDNFTRLKDAVGNVVSALIGLIDWPSFLRGFADGFNDVTTAVTNVVVWVSELLAKFLGLEPVKKFFQDNSYEIGKFMGAIAGAAAVVLGFNGAVKVLRFLFSPLTAMFKLALSPLKSLVSILTGAPAAISGAIGAFKGLASTIGGVIGVGGNGGGLTGLAGALGGISAPVMAVVAVVAVLAGAFVNLMNTDEDFRNSVTETWNRITQSFSVVGEIIQPLLDTLNEALHKLAEAFGIPLDPATGLWDTISQMLKPALEAIMAVFENLVYMLEGAFVVALGAVTSAVSAVIGFFSGFMESVGGVLKVFQGLGDFLIGIFTGDLEKTRQGFQNMADGAGQIVSGMVSAITGFFTGLGDGIIGIMQGLGINVSGIWEGIKGGISGAADAIGRAVTGSFNWLKDAVKGIFDTIGSFMTNPIQTAKNVISGIVDTLRGIFNFEWKLPQIKLPHFRFTTQSFLGITIPIFSGIDWYAKGGIFDGATIAGIGEAGPEAVVPLQGARMKPFAEAIAGNIKLAGSSSVSGNDVDWDAMIAAMSAAVYNAVVQGFPKKIESNLELDGVKVNKQLDTIRRQQGSGTSLVKAV